MKLQVALDLLDGDKALSIAREVKDFVDIIEAGTPLVKSCGISIVKRLKQEFPNKLILADLKTMDTGFLESELAFKAGADITTICAAAADSTIKGGVKAAKKYKKKLLVDLIDVKNPVERAKQVLKLGCDLVCLHLGIDEQVKGRKLVNKAKAFDELNLMGLCLAGGINASNIKYLLKANPEVVIVGSAITKSKNPGSVAKKLRGLIV